MTKALEMPKKVEEKSDKPKTVCFVCSGNTCRSPMAQAVLNHLGKGVYRAESAGVSALTGDVISASAVRALEKAGIESTPENNYKNHRARQTELELLERFDIIVAISRGHLLSLLCNYPSLAERVTTLGQDIPDPFMQGDAAYEACLDTIIKCVKERFLL